VTAIDGQAFRTECNKPVTWSALQADFVERTPVKNTSGEPSTENAIEAVRLCAFDPPGSPVNRCRVIVFPRSMNYVHSTISSNHPTKRSRDFFNPNSRLEELPGKSRLSRGCRMACALR
jgi:hypothetical protein